MRADRYSFRPRLDLRVTGDRAALRHFQAEYGAAAVPDDGSPPVVEVRFRRGVAGSGRIEGGHKTVRWTVALSSSGAAPLAADVELGGVPRSFALSLVQGYFIEPLLSVAAARAGYVLLPAAAIRTEDTALVLMGASGAGKSTLSVRALATGRGLLGDDQILVDAEGRCFRFPRRMRFYSDLRLAAPAAWARLRAGPRARLQARRAVRALSRGIVAPSLPLAAAEIADPGPAGPFPVGHVVLLERSPQAHELRREPLDESAATAHAIALLDAQRDRLAAGATRAWEETLAQARELEAGTLAAGFAVARLERVAVPRSWSAGQAVGRLAAELGTEG